MLFARDPYTNTATFLDALVTPKQLYASYRTDADDALARTRELVDGVRSRPEILEELKRLSLEQLERVRLFHIRATEGPVRRAEEEIDAALGELLDPFIEPLREARDRERAAEAVDLALCEFRRDRNSNGFAGDLRRLHGEVGAAARLTIRSGLLEELDGLERALNEKEESFFTSSPVGPLVAPFHFSQLERLRGDTHRLSTVIARLLREEIDGIDGDVADMLPCALRVAPYLSWPVREQLRDSLLDLADRDSPFRPTIEMIAEDTSSEDAGRR